MRSVAGACLGDGDSAHAQLQEWAGKTAVRLVLYDDAGNKLIG